MGIRDLRNKSRLDLHRRLAVPAVYIAADSTETPCSVRVHTRTRAFGDMPGLGYEPAERSEQVPEIVSLSHEVSPARGGVFSVAAGEAYAVETVDYPDGLTVSSQVTRLRPQETAGLPLPVGGYVSPSLPPSDNTGGSGSGGSGTVTIPLDDSVTSRTTLWSSAKTDEEIDASTEVGNLSLLFDNGLV